jgi:hypothetical protein
MNQKNSSRKLINDEKKTLTNEKNPVNRSISNGIDFDNLIESFLKRSLEIFHFKWK